MRSARTRRSATQADKDGFAEIVFCVASGKAMAKQVKTGIQSETLIQIVNGLAEGDEVVTGSYRAISKDLVNGALVTISKEPLKDKPGDDGDEAAMRLPLALEESIPIAVDALRANKARGALTTLGIIIGIVAVVLTMTAANGLQNKFRESFSAVGSDVIYVSRMPWVVMNDFFSVSQPPRHRAEGGAARSRIGSAVERSSIRR